MEGDCTGLPTKNETLQTNVQNLFNLFPYNPGLNCSFKYLLIARHLKNQRQKF